MKRIPSITDTEWEVMRVIWAQNPSTAAEIIEQLMSQDSTWHPKTVRTLLARLVRKKALGYKAHGRLYVYEPLVSERECLAAASESFLARFFGGSLRPMLAHFIERRKLTQEHLAELEQLFETNVGGRPAGTRRKQGHE